MNTTSDDFTDEQIELFCQNYEEHLSEHPLLNSKIPIWVEYLKTKKYYRTNGMEEDYFFKKRFNVSAQDLMEIHKLLDRVARGKTLTQISKTKIHGIGGYGGFDNKSIYDSFDENIVYDGKPKFELMEELNPALEAYNNKMKKHSQRHKWKQGAGKKILDRNYGVANPYFPEGCVQDEPDRYYTEEMYSTRPQIEFGVQDFAKAKLFNMDKTEQIQKINKINEILDSNNLLTTQFNDEFKHSVPNLQTKKKVQFSDETNFNYTIGNNSLTPENRADWNFSNGMISGLKQGLEGPVKYTGSPESTRLWQDVDILSSRGNTRKSGIDNRNPFEHQFQYLDGNYNRVPDPRIQGMSSRTENRSTFKR